MTIVLFGRICRALEDFAPDCVVLLGCADTEKHNDADNRTTAAMIITPLK